MHVGNGVTKIFVLGPSLALTAACAAGMLYGFVPTGAVALVLAARAAAARHRFPDQAARLRDEAQRWLVATLLIGAAVELPVIAAAVV